MGATEFYTTAVGISPDAAFQAAREAALWDRGHGGYTGSVAEKSSYIVIPDTAEQVLVRYREYDCPNPRIISALQCGETTAIASALVELDDSRIIDKWGPAGCLTFGLVPFSSQLKQYLFFGWASV
jgi:hypothetical protein